MKMTVWGFFLAMAMSSCLEARWATLEDSEAVTEYAKAKLWIKSDGTYELESEELVEIKNEEGRNKHGNYRFPYTTDTTEVKVLEAKTINPQVTIPVADELIEDKPLASSVNGFDQINQITIAYPGIEIGSKLYRKLRMKVSKVRFPKFFSVKESLGAEMYVANAEYLIESELPLEVEKNDPRNVLMIEEKQQGGKHFLKVALKAPVYGKAADEKDSYLHPSQETWFVISSAKEYATMAQSAVAEYEKVISAALPASFEKILQEAKKKTSLVDKINTVTSRLSEEVRYLGEWRTIRGGFIPRTLSEVARTRFGDCKDYSAITTAILRKLGFEASVAWVYRAGIDVPLPKLAYDSGFNHAIVWAKHGDRIFWVDPTNLTSFAQGIYEDIMDRQALVLHAQPKMEHIPVGKPEDSMFERRFAIQEKPGQVIEMQSEIKLIGRAAVGVTGIGNRISKEGVKYMITQALAGERLVLSSDIAPQDLKSRIVENVTLKGKIRIKNFMLKTSAGKGFPLEFDPLKFLMDMDLRDRVSGVRLAQPVTQQSVFVLKNAKAVGSANLSCSVTSPWVEVSRQVKPNKKDIVVTDTMEIKRSYISNNELLGSVYANFQKKLQDCLYQVAIVYRPSAAESRKSPQG